VPRLSSSLHRILMGVVALSLAFFASAALAAPWHRAGAEALRQTVPLTPPATWTPAAPAAPPPEPTIPQPPDHSTALPPAEEPDPVPTALPGPAEPTRPAADPTQAPPASPEAAAAQPWLGLSARPQIVAPGDVVTLRLELVNLGPGDLAPATVTLGPVRHLTLRPSGTARVVAGELRWSAPRLAAGEGAVVEVQAVVGEGLLPGEEMVFAGEVAGAGEGTESNEALLVAPQAVLPGVGTGPQDGPVAGTPNVVGRGRHD
jgi:hypothetical protein